jgi:outer membrane autotransporter protein
VVGFVSGITLLTLSATASAIPPFVCPTGTTCTLAPGTVIDVPTGGVGMSAAGATGVLTAHGVTVNLNGTGTIAARAQSGSLITSNGITVNSLAGGGVNGLIATGAGSRVQAANVAITLNGSGGFGAQAAAGGTVSITAGSIVTQGTQQQGLAALNGSTLTATNVDVTTTATGGINSARAAFASGPGSTVTITGGSLTTTGTGASGEVPHAVAAIAGNAGGNTLTTTGTNIRSMGDGAFGVVADNGGLVTLNGTGPGMGTVRTDGAGSNALFVGLSASDTRAASITTNGMAIETFGANAGGVLVQQNKLAVAATITTNDSTITTHGAGSVGLRSELFGTVISNRSTVLTEGVGAHGALARDNSSVTLNQTSVTTTGVAAHGAVAQEGGRILGDGATLNATGADAVALLASSGGANPSVASLTNSTLSSASGPAIGVAGKANISLTGGTVTGASGQWLRVGGTGEFPALASAVATLLGLPDPGTGVIDPSEPLPVVPATASGLANVVLSGVTVNGAVVTGPGSVTNLELRNNSVWNLTGNSNLTNLLNDPSMILFSPPVGGVFKTLTVNNYVGDGGSIIGLNTRLDGDGSPSDQLIINGGTATGQSGIRITNAGGQGALTTSDGIRVVQVINGGTTAPTAFTLSGRAVAGPFEYRLFRGGIVDPNDNNWYLRSTAESPIPPGPQPTPPAPLIRPEVGAYLANQRASGGLFLHTLHDRLGEPQFLEPITLDARDPQRYSVWLRGDGRTSSVDGAGNGFHASADAGVVQGGGDIAFRSLLGDRDRLLLGLMGAWGTVQSRVRSENDPNEARASVDAYAIGAYTTWYQNNTSRLGLYADLWFLHGWYNQQVKGDFLPTVDYDATAWTFSGEAGYALPLFTSGWVLEPQGQLIGILYDQPRATEDNGTVITGASGTGFVSRLGARVYRTFFPREAWRLEPFLGFNWWHDTASDSSAINGLKFSDLFPTDRYEAKLGVHADFGRGWGAWANFGVQFGAQDYQQFAGRIGVKYAW